MGCWKWAIAGTLATGGVITALGSGMTFKFWPLFFKDDWGFDMAQVCLLNIGVWASIAVSASFLNPILLKCLENLSAACFLHFSGTFLLFVISRIAGMPLWAEVSLVILRNALMNSSGPLTQAVVLGLVPNHHRGKWSSISALSRMTWSGSAFLGGMLSDSHDFRYAFFITACVHTVSGCVLIAAT